MMARLGLNFPRGQPQILIILLLPVVLAVEQSLGQEEEQEDICLLYPERTPAAGVRLFQQSH
jgi:hypothetical protein